jgi:hypothetical protein
MLPCARSPFTCLLAEALSSPLAVLHLLHGTGGLLLSLVCRSALALCQLLLCDTVTSTPHVSSSVMSVAPRACRGEGRGRCTVGCQVRGCFRSEILVGRREACCPARSVRRVALRCVALRWFGQLHSSNIPVSYSFYLASPTLQHQIRTVACSYGHSSSLTVFSAARVPLLRGRDSGLGFTHAHTTVASSLLKAATFTTFTSCFGLVY